MEIEQNDILQKTMLLEEPMELSGNNLRNRNAMQVVDAFEKNAEITLRLTAIYMDYSMTHIGFSVDPPFSDWNITDVTIVDDRGKTYWVSISRPLEHDPFFPVRIITDAISPDVRELMISVRRLYLPDRKMEEGYELTLTGEEEQIFDNIPMLGDDGSISLEIREINKKLRELERKRFFHLPIVKNQIKGRWSFVVPINHSIRSRVHRLYRLNNQFTAGSLQINPCFYKTGILRNELVCEYHNNKLKEDFFKEGKSVDKEESIIFVHNRFSPIPPLITIFDSIKHEEHFPRGEQQNLFSRGAGNVIWTNNNRLLLHYKFEPFECSDETPEICLRSIEMPAQNIPEIQLSPGKSSKITFPVWTDSQNEHEISIDAAIIIQDRDTKTHCSFAELKYSYSKNDGMSDFWITESHLFDNDGNVLQVSTQDIEKEGNHVTIKVVFELSAKTDYLVFTWKIDNYYYKLKEPVRQKLKITGISKPGDFERELSLGKVIMPGEMGA